MKSSTKILAYGLIAYLLYRNTSYLHFEKKPGMKGLDGLSDYPYPGSQPGYYSGQAYSNWYTGTYLPWYFQTYRQYPPSYQAYMQQGQANLFYQGQGGQQYIDFDAPTPIQNRPQQYYQQYQQPYYYGYQQPYYQQQYGQQYPQYGYQQNQANVALYPM